MYYLKVKIFLKPASIIIRQFPVSKIIFWLFLRPAVEHVKVNSKIVDKFFFFVEIAETLFVVSQLHNKVNFQNAQTQSTIKLLMAF